MWDFRKDGGLCENLNYTLFTEKFIEPDFKVTSKLHRFQQLINEVDVRVDQLKVLDLDVGSSRIC